MAIVRLMRGISALGVLDSVCIVWDIWPPLPNTSKPRLGLIHANEQRFSFGEYDSIFV